MGMESDLAETGGNDQTCSQDKAAPGVDDANFGVPLSEDCQFTLSPSFQFPPGFDNASFNDQCVLSAIVHLPNAIQHQDQNHNRTQSLNDLFRGPSHPTNIVNSFEGLLDFVRKTIEEHHILGAQQTPTQPVTPIQPVLSYSTDQVECMLKAYLPMEQQCQHLLRCYFDHFGGIHSLFNIPSFWKQYTAFRAGVHVHPIQFNALSLAMMSCSRCLFAADSLSFIGDSSVARNEALQWLHMVECWQLHHTTEQTTIEAFQIRCLVLLSKNQNDINRQRHHAASQTLLADAISSGLHQDWKSHGIGETVFQRELRRKVWFTIVELDIASCIERGVPSMASNLFVDVGRPSNFNDCDLEESTVEEPQNQPDACLTDNTFARFVDSIRPLRYFTINVVNHPQKYKTMSRAKLTMLWQRIDNSLADLPHFSEPTGASTERCQVTMFRAVMQVYLHELLLLLHLPHAFTKDETHQIDMDYQRFLCVKSASTIINIYEQITEKGSSQIALPQSTLLRASLCLCLIGTNAPHYGRRPHDLLQP
jgi:hypothetical protein